MARTCPSCGHENADDVDFCAGCGGYLRWEPTRMATPAVPAPAPPPTPAAAPPASPTRPAEVPEPAAPPPRPQEPPPQPPEAEKKGGWRRKKLPGVQGGGVSGPRVQGPRVQAPRVNVGPRGVNVAAPKVQAPRLAPPRVRAPRVKQPRIPTTPKGIVQALKKGKLPGGGRGGSSGAVESGPVAPQPVETWHWDAVGRQGGRAKGFLVALLLVLFAGAATAAGWWFFVRDDDAATSAIAAPRVTPQAFAARLEPLLVRSARDRARISRAVTGVATCSLAPGPAAAQIGRTIQGRRTLLGQVRRVPTGSIAMRRARLLLERSLVHSAAAGRDYSLWIASFNGACPVRAGPEYARALATNRRAQATKIAFARAYNPIARNAGARTWKSTAF